MFLNALTPTYHQSVLPQVLACLAAVVSADAEAEADPYYLGSYGYGSYYRSFVIVIGGF